MAKNSFILKKGECLFNQRQKYFKTADGDVVLWETMTFPTQIFNPNGCVPVYEKKNVCSSKNEAEGDVFINSEKNEQSSQKGRNRAKKRLFDTIMADYSLDTMITLTFDKAFVERDNYNDIVKKLNVWLDNRVRRNGLKYVLVPEYHKDGTNIHFHGFMNSSALKLKDSGKKKKGRRVYNVSDFGYGFTTAIKLDENRQAAAYYCYKYITKDTERIGGRWMLSGGKLEKPVYLYDNVPYDEAHGDCVHVAKNIVCKVATKK